MPMMPFIGVRISWLMLARNSLLARLAFLGAVLGREELAVEGGQLRGAGRHLAFEALLMVAQHLVAVLDLFEHLVEARDERPDLVAAGLARRGWRSSSRLTRSRAVSEPDEESVRR